MRELLIQGHRFAISEHEGEGPPLLLLSSTGLDPRQWGALRRALPQRRALGLYYLGYPPSDTWLGSGTIDISLDFKAAEQLLLDTDGPVDIAGHSYGGFLALHLAQRHPSRVRRIAVHEPTAWGCLWESDREDLKADFHHIVEHFFEDSVSPELFLERFVDYWNAPGVWAAMAKPRKASWLHLAPKIMAEVKMLCLEQTPSGFYRDVEHDVTMTVGHNTPAHEAEVCRILASVLPNCRAVPVSGGHLGVVTHPSAVIPHLAEALSRAD